MSGPLSAARIGPNAIIQVAHALEARGTAATATDLFERAGLGAYLATPPQHMVDESEVIALHRALRAGLPDAEAREIARSAGVGTGDYLVSHRIPAVARGALRVLPAAAARRLLLRAIVRHAWTFAGSARFSARPGRPIELGLEDCPICRGAKAPGPICEYYTATFERLFARLIDARIRVRETACIASGAAACRFEIDWPR